MFGEKTDKYLRASTSGRARVREYDSWESLRETWLSADRSLDEENLHMLMKRGCKKLGMCLSASGLSMALMVMLPCCLKLVL